MFEMIQVLSDVTADSLSTWQDVMNATTPVLDSIILDATDDVNLKKRMLGQELGYLVMEALTDKYLDLEKHRESASSEELDRIVSTLQEALSCWFYSKDERLPHIWRDHYYVSNKNAEEPSNGFFHIMVSLPTPEHPTPVLYIYYPESAEGRPAIIFREHLEDDLVDDKFDLRDIVTLQDWYKKGSRCMLRRVKMWLRKCFAILSCIYCFKAGMPQTELLVMLRLRGFIWNLYR